MLKSKDKHYFSSSPLHSGIQFVDSVTSSYAGTNFRMASTCSNLYIYFGAFMFINFTAT